METLGSVTGVTSSEASTAYLRNTIVSFDEGKIFSSPPPQFSLPAELPPSLLDTARWREPAADVTQVFEPSQDCSLLQTQAALQEFSTPAALQEFSTPAALQEFSHSAQFGYGPESHGEGPCIT